MGKDKARLSGKPFEELIYKIYKELEPHATIKLNDMIAGISSKIEREIDISIRHKIADHEILIIIQAKDHKRSADIKLLGEFDSVIRDVQASKGIIICNAGFTKTAKEYAANRAIGVYSAHDASVKDWQTEIKIPVIRKHTTMTYDMRIPFEITKEMKEFYKGKKTKVRMIEGPEGTLMKKMDGTDTTFLKEFMNLWQDMKIDLTPGDHITVFDAYVDMFGNPDLFPPKPAELAYKVKTRHYLKYFTPIDYRGIKDYVTNKFRPSFIKIEGALPFSHDKTWKYIEDPTLLSINSIRLEIDIVDIQKMRFVRAEWKKES
jgi:hypothetical protein